MLKFKPSVILLFALFGLMTSGQSQGLWLAYNFGPAIGRTADLHVMVHPKNQDWLTINLSGGYTLNGNYGLPFNDACVSDYRNGGYHARLGFRNALTDDHHENHLFWGVNGVFSGTKEAGETNFCDPDQNQVFVEQNNMSIGAAVFAGYALNLSAKYLKPRLFMDFGAQMGFPVYEQQPYLGRMNYIPGLGYGKNGKMGWNIELIIMLRFEAWHGKYGYSKMKKFVR